MSACSQDDDSKNRVKEYETCCGADPVEIKVGEKNQLFIPNSFTPNMDGKNDVFRPYYSDDIRNMQFMTIYSLEGDTILYILRGSDVDNFANGMFGWDGTRTGYEPLYAGDWKIHKGGFKYEISILTPDEGYITINGKACAIQCGSDATVFRDNKNCFFPSQHGDKGVLDPKLFHDELECFR